MKLPHRSEPVTWAEIIADLLSLVVPYLCLHGIWYFADLEIESRRVFSIATCVPCSISLFIYIWQDVRDKSLDFRRLILTIVCAAIGWLGVISMFVTRPGLGISDISIIRGE